MIAPRWCASAPAVFARLPVAGLLGISMSSSAESFSVRTVILGTLVVMLQRLSSPTVPSPTMTRLLALSVAQICTVRPGAPLPLRVRVASLVAWPFCNVPVSASSPWV